MGKLCCTASLMPCHCCSQGWGWSFVVPGLLMIFLGLLIFFFLVVQPSDVGLPSPYEQARTYEQLRTDDDMVSDRS